MDTRIINRFEKTIRDMKSRGLYRDFLPISRIAGSFPNADRGDPACNWPHIKVWCTNDYLGMGQHASAIDVMVRITQRHGIGSGGSRNISGTTTYHVALEEELASLHQKDAALVFTSGYMSNEASITAISKVLPDAIFFSDELNHASIIQGIRNSRARKEVFRHNDTAHLRELLQQSDPDSPRVIICESIYSMEGDVGPLEEIADIAAEFDALTFLDEVHAVGLYGPGGGGIAANLGISDRFDIIQGTLAKGFGSIGGYITGPAAIVDAVRSFGSSFIFTTSLPPGNVASALETVKWLRKSDNERNILRRKVRLLHKCFEENSIPVVSKETHIAPVMIGDGDRCKEAAKHLLRKHGIYVQPVNYPSVPFGTARLRVTPTPLHQDEDIVSLAVALRETLDTLDMVTP